MAWGKEHREICWDRFKRWYNNNADVDGFSPYETDITKLTAYWNNTPNYETSRERTSAERTNVLHKFSVLTLSVLVPEEKVSYSGVINRLHDTNFLYK